MPRKNVTYNQTDNSYIFECPYCDILIQVLVSDTACCIFRHAVFKNNGEPINPHSTKEQCDSFVNNGIVIGCARPFQLFKNDNYIYVEECDYI